MRKLKSYLSFINESNINSSFEDKFKSLIGKEFTKSDLDSMLKFIKEEESEDLFAIFINIIFDRFDFQDTFTHEDKDDLNKIFNSLLSNKDLSKEDIANCLVYELNNLVDSDISSDEELKKQIMDIL